eukprot:304855-Pleurochrysis_carterae.AAC.1
MPRSSGWSPSLKYSAGTKWTPCTRKSCVSPAACSACTAAPICSRMSCGVAAATPVHGVLSR